MITKLTGPDYLIVGMEKSGTTWCSTILNSHPDILSISIREDWKTKGIQVKNEWEKELIGELHFFNTIASLNKKKTLYTRPISNYITKHKLLFKDIAQLEGKLSDKKLIKLFLGKYNEIFEDQRIKQKKELAGEATPAYIFYLEDIDTFYPNVKKICILRDPKDRVVSFFYNEVRKGRIKDMSINDSFINDYCNSRINNEYEALINYQGDIKCILYEDLNSQKAPNVVKNMLDYLDCVYNHSTIQKMVSNADFSILSKQDHGTISRQKGEENIHSQFRKGIVGDWKNNLSMEQASLVENLTDKLKKIVYKKYRL